MAVIQRRLPLQLLEQVDNQVHGVADQAVLQVLMDQQRLTVVMVAQVLMDRLQQVAQVVAVAVHLYWPPVLAVMAAQVVETAAAAAAVAAA